MMTMPMPMDDVDDEEDRRPAHGRQQQPPSRRHQSRHQAAVTTLAASINDPTTTPGWCHHRPSSSSSSSRATLLLMGWSWLLLPLLLGMMTLVGWSNAFVSPSNMNWNMYHRATTSSFNAPQCYPFGIRCDCDRHCRRHIHQRRQGRQWFMSLQDESIFPINNNDDNDNKNDNDFDKNDMNGSGVKVFRCDETLDELGMEEKKKNNMRKDDPLKQILMLDDGNNISNGSSSSSKTNTISLLEPILYEQDETPFSLRWEAALKWTPITIPVVAFWLYDPTALFFTKTLQSLTSKSQNWVAVDGGAYQARIITPAINGIVVQAIAILFAVLIGNTIDNLRTRQKDICDCIQMEATQLRILISLLDVMDGGGGGGGGDNDVATNGTDNNNNIPPSDVLSIEMQQSCRQYLLQYTSRLIAEGHENTNIDALSGGGGGSAYTTNMQGGIGTFGSSSNSCSSNDNELNGILAQLNRAAVMSTHTTPPGSQFVITQCYETTRRLLETRSKRLTALASTFPPLHYTIIATLALSICIAFLMETDQDILVFLNAIQLRLLWTSLVGTFCALGVVLYDLGHPFRGSYQVSNAVNQLYGIRLNLKQKWKATEEERMKTKKRNDDDDGLGKANGTIDDDNINQHGLVMPLDVGIVGTNDTTIMTKSPTIGSGKRPPL